MIRFQFTKKKKNPDINFKLKQSSFLQMCHKFDFFSNISRLKINSKISKVAHDVKQLLFGKKKGV